MGGLIAFSATVVMRAHAVAPAEGKWIEIDGQRVHYLDMGSGPAIVMVHGLAGNLRNFGRPLVEDLARDHRVILIDRPGSGHSQRRAGGSTALPDQAAIVAELIEELGLERPLLVGHSMGGAVALAVALDHAELISGLALIAPLTQAQEEYARLFRTVERAPAPLRKGLCWTLATPLILANRSRSRRRIFGPEPVPADFSAAGGGLLSARPGALYEATSDMAAINRGMAGLVARYTELKLPVSILFARGDGLLDHRKHGELTARQIPGAALELIDGGHMIPFTQPERTLAWLRGVLARHEGLREHRA